MTQTLPVRVAISGGGIAGATLLHALLKCPNLDVHIFESAAAFKEAGAAIGLPRQALRALELIGPSATKCLYNAGAVPQQHVCFKIAQGLDAGKTVDEVDDNAEPLTSIVHRAEFLRELLKGVEEQRMHASKKVVKVERDGEMGPLTLHFSDGTTHECDILIGADGIHSFVRRAILGEDDPAATPVFSGFWVVQVLKPYEDTEHNLGRDLVNVDTPKEYGWMGDGNMILHNVLGDGKLVQFVVGFYTDKPSTDWFKPVPTGEIEEAYGDWPPNLSKAVKELVCDVPEHTAWYIWEHLHARTYAKGPMCVMGDAAHSTTPWQASGAAMSVEDSLILSTLLGRAKSPAEAEIALQVYSQVRLPRTQRIVDSSKETGIIFNGKGPDGLRYEKLKGILRRWEFIIDFDNARARDEAVAVMDAELVKRGGM